MTNFLVRIGIDSSKFTQGSRKMGQDTAQVRQSIATLNTTLNQQVSSLNLMVKQGRQGTALFQQLSREVRKTEGALKMMQRQLDGAGGKMKGLGGLDMGQIGGALTGGLIGGGAAGAVMMGIQQLQQTFKEAINDASNLNETVSKSNVIFGSAANEVQVFAKSAADALGQSTQQALDGAATFGVFGKSAGLAGSDLAKFSTDFVTLASDMASFSNTTPEEAITAIGAALRGESEPIRKYGVLLNDATLKQEAMALGIYDGNGALTAQQKILAAQSAIYKQTTDAQGDFARTSQGLANQQRILSANLENISANLGSALLPIVNSVAGGMVSLIKQMKGFESASIDVAEAGRQVTDQLMSEQAEMNAMFNVLKSGNISTENRKKLLDEINTRYKPYLTNLIDETSSLDDIAKAQNSANVAFKESIRLKATQAMAAAAIEKQIALEKEALQIELDLENARVGNFKAIKSLGFSALGYQGATERLNYLLKLNREEAQKLQEEYGQIAAASQKASAAVDAVSGKTENAADDAKEAIDNVGGAAQKATSKVVEMVQTAASVYEDLQNKLESGSEYYALIGDELGKLQADHQALESAMMAAWKAGGYGAANYVMALKAQLDETQKAIDSIKMMKETPAAAPMIATGGQRRLGAAGGIVLPQENRTKQIDEESAAFQRQKMIAEELNNVYNQMGQSFGSMMESLASGSATAQEAFRAFAISALNAAQQFIQAQIAAAAAAQIKENSKFGLPGIALAGVAVAGLFGLLRGALSRSKSVKLAEGGIISGRTMAEVGEYPGAAFNPEVVAPLDKLQAMLDIGGSTHVTGTFRVQGSDLVLALDNAQRKMNQFRV